MDKTLSSRSGESLPIANPAAAAAASLSSSQSERNLSSSSPSTALSMSGLLSWILELIFRQESTM